MSWHLLQTWWCQYTYIFSTTIHGIWCHTFRGSTEKETNTNDRTIPMQHFNLIQLIYHIPYSYKLQCAGHLLKWAMNIFFGTHARATTTTITRETERERDICTSHSTGYESIFTWLKRYKHVQMQCTLALSQCGTHSYPNGMKQFTV